MTKPEHKNDFEALYNLRDPGPYYRGLEPADYRMPGVVSGLIRACGERLRAARRQDARPLRLLDIGCGFGAVGTLLRYNIGMRDLFTYHGGHSQADRGPSAWEADKGFLAGKKRDVPPMEIAGLDIADRALDYAKSIGAIDQVFAENLVANDPSPALIDWLATTDIVMECGALAILYEPGFRRMIEASVPNRPWFLLCPRPDADRTPVVETLNRLGYQVEELLAPTDYRKCLSAREEAEVISVAAKLGREGADAYSGGYLQVPILLFRHQDDCDASVSDLLQGWRDEGANS